MPAKNSKRIEIEFRSRFSKRVYLRLKKFLDRHAKNLSQDDKDVHFFIFPDKLLKVVSNVSKKNAKVVLKLNKIGRGSDFEEIEIPIDTAAVKSWVALFTRLGFRNMMHSYQKRQNYLYKGVEAALKWSKAWGHHLELEVLVRTETEKKLAEIKIKRVAKELGVGLMTDRELRKFTKSAEAEYARNLRS